MITKVFSALLLLACMAVVPVALAQDGPIDRSSGRMGATTTGVLTPPGSSYYPTAAELGLGPAEEEPAGPVINIEGDGVKKLPDSVGPVRSSTVQGKLAPEQ